LEKEVLAHRFGALSSSRDESNFLGWLVGTLGVKRVIEVGVFLGATTLAIAQVRNESDKERRREGSILGWLVEVGSEKGNRSGCFLRYEMSESTS
jgi:hypothetical protein